MKTLFLIVGGNGAGKTTYYYQFLKGKGIPFVNADEICAAKYAPDDKDRDGKAQADAFRLFDEMLDSDESFCYETVFSHPSKLEFIKKAKLTGFQVNLIYIVLNDPLLHLQRVQVRVSKGGHNVPEDKILERLKRIPGLVKLALEIVDKHITLDNSGSAYIQLQGVPNV